MPKRANCSHPDVEAGTLYAVVSGGESRFWQHTLFLCFSAAEDSLFGMWWTIKQTQQQLRREWNLTSSSKPGDFPDHPALFVRLGSMSRIGSLEEVEPAIAQAVDRVDIQSSKHRSIYNSLTWLIDAVAELDESAILSCINTGLFEREVKRHAKIAIEMFDEDGLYAVMDSAHCSEDD